jgi:hypothetical protein
MNVVIIAGMHRSSTSLFTQYMKQCGLYIGSNLIGSNIDNKDGYFENATIVDIQQSIIQRKGFNIFNSKTFKEFEEVDKIKIMEEVQRNKNNCNYCKYFAIKDPRNSLFLDAWIDLYPQAKFIFIYRDCSEVVDSLIRRRTDREIKFWPFLAVSSWINYNEALIDFMKKNKDNTILISNNEFIDNSENVINQINKMLDLNLSYSDIKNIYKPHLTKRRSKPILLSRMVLYVYRQKILNVTMQLKSLQVK